MIVNLAAMEKIANQAVIKAKDEIRRLERQKEFLECFVSHGNPEYDEVCEHLYDAYDDYERLTGEAHPTF